MFGEKPLQPLRNYAGAGYQDKFLIPASAYLILLMEIALFIIV